jgi:SAM-dependent methyltransferase
VFDVAGDRYDRFMGRFSRTLAPPFADFAGVERGMRVLDVGCGPGSFTVELIGRVGEGNVAAMDPQEQFVDACRSRAGRADVRRAPAEEIPWEDGAFDVAAAQLVMAFVTDGPRSVGEMARVVRPGGTVAACVWDTDRLEMFERFWRAVHEVEGSEPSNRRPPYSQQGQLRELFESAGLHGVVAGDLPIDMDYASFDDYWEPLTWGIGPAGAYCASLDPETQTAVRDAIRRELDDPDRPFTLRAVALAARGTRR